MLHVFKGPGPALKRGFASSWDVAARRWVAPAAGGCILRSALMRNLAGEHAVNAGDRGEFRLLFPAWAVQTRRRPGARGLTINKLVWRLGGKAQCIAGDTPNAL